MVKACVVKEKRQQRPRLGKATERAKPGRRFVRDAVATIGHGVKVAASTIQGAGLGLFAARGFDKHELLTEYDGERITHAQALALRQQGEATHVRVVSTFFAYINGLKEPIDGRGGGSFANDIDRSKSLRRCNAVFATRVDSWSGETKVFLKAERAIRAGEEIWIAYGRGYWRLSSE